ncbi:MAG: molybdopterin molybdotransferase MoeA [Deltaproteobacteria bacterium]|nr:molybdopterin molybdotransferase MoeA [Deltaproteobacteria bacterium]
MLTVEEAQKEILNFQTTNSPTKSPLLECGQQVLSDNIYSPHDMPLFSSSAMDGYAVRIEDLSEASSQNPIQLKVVDDIWAGKTDLKPINTGECSRIMTGAMIPENSNAVVMQENVEVLNGNIVVNKPLRLFENIRTQGEELKRDQLALERGHILNSASLGFLASLGFSEVPVYSKPKVTIISTGTELVPPGHKLGTGQIYESNSIALQSALKNMQINAEIIGPLKDEKDLIFKSVSKALNESTHLILCGGVSVGDYDLNKGILADCQVTSHFWKVAQKPGKPFFFGSKEKTLVFGVPGNPASSLVCFYNYIRPALLQSLGYSDQALFLHQEKAKFTDNLSAKKPGRTYFERAHAFLKNDQLFVSLTGKQGSHMMQSFSMANCLLQIKGNEEIKKDALVTIHWLPDAKGGRL